LKSGLILGRDPEESTWRWDLLDDEITSGHLSTKVADNADADRRSCFGQYCTPSVCPGPCISDGIGQNFDFCDRCVRCSCVVKMEDALFLISQHGTMNSRSQIQAGSKVGKCRLLPEAACEMILSAIQFLFKLDSGNRGSLTLSILRSLPALLLHCNHDSVLKVRQLLQDAADLVFMPDVKPTIRSAAARMMSALAYGDGWGIILLQNAKNLEHALINFQRKFGLVCSIEEPSDQESMARLHSAFLAAGGIATALASHYVNLRGISTCCEGIHSDHSFSRYGGENLAFAVPLIVDLVVNCVVCHEREQHSLVRTAYQAVDQLGMRFGGNAITIVGDPSIKKCIYSKLVSMVDENDLLFSAFFAIFYSITGIEDLKNKLLEEVASAVVPDLIVQGKEDLISRFAALCHTEPEELILREFPYIMAHLFLVKSGGKGLQYEDAVQLALKLGACETEADKAAIINDNASETLDIVLWEVCQYETEGEKRYRTDFFGRICNLYCGPGIGGEDEYSVTDQPLSIIMQHHSFKHYYSRLMHNIFTDYFKSEGSLLSDQLRALKLVNFTIPLLGIFLDEHFAYLESILKSAQHIPQLQEFVCRVWSTLIRSLGPTSLQIKTNLSQIVVNLLSLGESYPELVASTIEFLLVEHRSQLEVEIKLIPSVETNRPELQRAAAILHGYFSQESNLAALIEVGLQHLFFKPFALLYAYLVVFISDDLLTKT
jgi:hypothetical protein